MSGVRRYPGVFVQPPAQAWLAGVDFNSPLPNYTFERCQISKTSPPSQSKHLGEERPRRGAKDGKRRCRFKKEKEKAKAERKVPSHSVPSWLFLFKIIG